MKFTIQNHEFDTEKIARLYAAALIKTGYGDEVTQASLEWLDTESKGRVEVAGYGIFIHFKDETTAEFVFKTRQEMDALARDIARQLQTVHR